jgi:hypothetical protein
MDTKNTMATKEDKTQPFVPFVPFVFVVYGVSSVWLGASHTALPPYQHTFTAPRAAEIVATVVARCDRCAWDVEGREAVMLKVTLNGRYVQHLPLVRTGRAEYDLLIGEVPPGTHTIAVDPDDALTATGLRGGHGAVVESVAIRQIAHTSPEYRAVAFAPFVYARPDTVGRFTDVPVFMWYETEQTSRGTRYRYSVIFSNEDGGTPADRLMATWGRTTDIEYIHSVEIDAHGDVLDADMQGPKHEVLPFRGAREGVHPLLWVSTENNMVLDRGTTTVRFAPAPISAQLLDVSREVLMDERPWLYELSARELEREKKIAPDAPPGTGQIPDPRRFVYLEGCGQLGGAAIAFAIHVKGGWIASDRGVRDYRIARDGCFRAAIPVPVGIGAEDVRALRAQAYTRASTSGTPPPPAGKVHLTRINRAFMLDDSYAPRPRLMNWTGSLALEPDGAPVTIVTR